MTDGHAWSVAIANTRALVAIGELIGLHVSDHRDARPGSDGDTRDWEEQREHCRECLQPWPCRTRLAILGILPGRTQ